MMLQKSANRTQLQGSRGSGRGRVGIAHAKAFVAEEVESFQSVQSLAEGGRVFNGHLRCPMGGRAGMGDRCLPASLLWNVKMNEFW